MWTMCTFFSMVSVLKETQQLKNKDLYLICICKNLEYRNQQVIFMIQGKLFLCLETTGTFLPPEKSQLQIKYVWALSIIENSPYSLVHWQVRQGHITYKISFLWLVIFAYTFFSCITITAESGYVTIWVMNSACFINAPLAKLLSSPSALCPMYQSLKSSIF